MSSKIEWTEDTWNPLIGCDKVSAGCKNCYAIQTAWIRMHNPAMVEKYAGTVEKTAGGALNWTGKVNFSQKDLLKPFLKKRPTVYFVNSMSDLFHEAIPFTIISSIFSVMSDCDRHTFQILTKRPDRAVEFFRWQSECKGVPWQPSANVWIGVSVENQKRANERIPKLLQLPVAVRFLSCEPLLGSVELGPELLAVDWVICGGESGKGSRPMHPDWARSLRDECAEAGIPFFFKQWGNWLPWEHDAQPPFFNSQNGKIIDGHALPDVSDHPKWDDGLWTAAEDLGACIFENVGKKKAGRMLDGKIHNEYPNPNK